jgi:hypothetical protein
LYEKDGPLSEVLHLLVSHRCRINRRDVCLAASSSYSRMLHAKESPWNSVTGPCAMMSTGELELLHVSREKCIQTGSLCLKLRTTILALQQTEKRQESLGGLVLANTLKPDHFASSQAILRKERTIRVSLPGSNRYFHSLLRRDQIHNLNLNVDFDFSLDPTRPNLPNRTKIKPTLAYSQRKPACISSSPSPACSSPSPTRVP